jgi:hypothetical protein
VDERRTAPRKTLFVDGGRGLRVSWHEDRGWFVLSLWQSDLCVGTFRLDAAEALRLADVLATHAGQSTQERWAG